MNLGQDFVKVHVQEGRNKIPFQVDSFDKF